MYAPVVEQSISGNDRTPNEVNMNRHHSSFLPSIVGGPPSNDSTPSGMGTTALDVKMCFAAFQSSPSTSPPLILMVGLGVPSWLIIRWMTLAPHFLQK